ncbi:MAG: RluA family pseudouridine synthase [Syntrophus sp. (in: bacteria)]|nr:RluA family pseudouridine synthase [Syntrophus sp. (in: bacteria)]
MENRFRIISQEEDKRLDLFLSEKLSLTRTKVKSMIEGGHVRLDGKPLKPSSKLKKGMKLEGEIPAEEPLTLTPESIPLDILFEDEYILAVNKPDNMVVHPSFGHRQGTLVNAILAYLAEKSSMFNVQGSTLKTQNTACPAEGLAPVVASNIEHRTLNVEHRGGDVHIASPVWPRPGIVHRLDKGTTGVILIAKDTKTQEMLSASFKDRTVRKTYRAIVEGVMEKDKGVIEGSIGRHPVERKKMAVVKERGRDALTGYKVIKRLNGFTYVEAYPKTGRTHQIRVHLAHIGHPVVGDDAYGKKAKKAAGRPLLHAYAITFPHPVKGGEVTINAPIPLDIKEFVSDHEV